MGILNKAFCCCQLTTSAMLLGWLGAAGYFITLVGLLVSFEDINFSRADELRFIIQIVVTLCGIFVSLINMVGCVCLMIGTIKKIRLLLLPWLIGEIIFIFFVIFVCVGCIVDLVKYPRYYRIFPVAISFLFLAFQIYVWLCVYSLFQEFRRQDNQKLGVEAKKSTTIKIKDDPQPYSSFA